MNTINTSEDNVDVFLDECQNCQGDCCTIYADNRRPPDICFEEWCEQWQQLFIQCGIDKTIAPLFDPLEVHLKGNEQMMFDLMAKGIDPDSCQYRGLNGCLIPRHLRPRLCREYVCIEG